MAFPYFEGIGAARKAAQRVRVASGSGKFIVNDKEAADFFTRAATLRIFSAAQCGWPGTQWL